MFNKILFVVIFFLSLTDVFSLEIKDYRVVNIPVLTSQNKLLIAIRSFKLQNKSTFLAVDPFAFTTSLHRKQKVKQFFIPFLDLVKLTDFHQALQKNSQAPYRLQNYGLKKTVNSAPGYFLTVDLCPSTSPFDKHLFTRILNYRKNEAVIPVALCVSGLWLKKHLSEFNWLLKQQKQKKIAITWVNHSWSHPYFRNKPLRQNFLLSKGISFEQEVLDVEKALLERGVMPSIFFRFPGLVSNKKLILKLKKMNLISLGSSSWMAKNEIPQLGSIILVHGNGNEPLGLSKLFLFLAKKEKWFKKGKLKFLELRCFFD